MGNWRTVQIVGGMLAEEVHALREELNQVLRPGWGGGFSHRYAQDNAQLEKFGPLSNTGGLCGIGDWPAPSINAVGNLAERDYSPCDVADHLEKLRKVAPSLGVMIHCGGERESPLCGVTVVLLEGRIEELPPMIKTLGDIPKLQIENNMLRALLRPYNRTL
jgi:hypothetical protein